MALDPGIFKAYDIRGIAGDQLGPDDAFAIGRAFARVLGQLQGKPTAELRLGLGRDMRLTAPEMAARYRDGMVAEGAHVLDCGMVGTEVLYFLVGSRGLDGGLMCTASHNPKAYTGAKLVGEGALALSGDRGIGEMRDLLTGDEDLPEAPGGGSVEEVDVWAAFREAAWEFIEKDDVKPLKVVVDGGNGMAGPMVGPLLRDLPLELVETYFVPDGEFPDHEPNPLLPENRQFIIDEVRKHGADLGIAWDGDADRCFFIDDTGEFVDGDFLTAILAEHLLAKQPGSAILYDVRASRAVADVVQAAGGTAHANRVGHAFFKTRMRDEGAIFGGEVSGHYYFHDFYNADSGTIPALLVLEKLSVEGAKLSALVGRYKQGYFISGEINSEVEDADARMAEIEQRYAGEGGRVTKLDGVSVDFDDWHFNVRASNTEPLLRLNLESVVSVEDMERRRDEVLGIIPRVIHRLSIPTPFAVGRVNCWLVDDDPLTLVDAGPNSGKALDELEQQLGALGRRIEDLERLVLTHQHIDHIGLASILQRRSGAEVCALATLAPWLSSYSEAMEDDDAFAEGIMRRNGIPGDVATALRAVTRGFRGWGASVEVTTPLTPGDEVAFASRAFRVHHRPGHSPSDTTFHDEADGTLIGGDHLLPKVSSNPLVTRPLDGSGDAAHRPQALVTYLASLAATHAQEVTTVLPGHGDAFTGHRELIDERRRLHDRRRDKLSGLIQERPRSAYELAQALWGEVALTQAYLTLSEVLGHVDLLLEDGEVAEEEHDGVVVFTSRGSAPRDPDPTGR